MNPLWRLALFLCLTASQAGGEAMLQYFNTSWRELTHKIPEIAEAGYESLWIPPPTKAGGAFSVGYDLFDRFDLGSKDQRGSVRTRYGTERELLNLIKVAHRFGIRVYFDSIMNHNGFDVPGFNESVAEDFYPGFRPGDFHLRTTAEGFYRRWDNTRDWGSEWQVQNLGLSGLIDIATEPGVTNRNHGRSEGDTSNKPVYLRHPDNPEYYCYIPGAGGQTHAANEGTYVGFGPENGITRAFLRLNESFYGEIVEDMLHRSLRWQLDRTKADGARLDAVKHTPADFFGSTFGGDRDVSDYGFLGQAQRQFNLTRGYLDENHRDTVFSIDTPRDDAMFFGEHLGQPPSYGPYIDAGMRLIDNDLRNNLNRTLGNPSASLAGYDQPGAGGVGPNVSVMHAQSHDNDYAARRELQHALYFTRDGLPLVYTDGNYHAGTLEGSGGAFPRHSNTAFLGQFGDTRLPNLAYVHQHFARGSQRPRWSDNDFLAYERIDKRENPRMSDEDGVVALVMVNDNYAEATGRDLTTTFSSTPFSGDAYLFQYARGYGSQVGFYKYASQLREVVVDPGSYMVFSYRTPEECTSWSESGGRSIEIFQGEERASEILVARRDGPTGDAGFSGPFANPGFHPRPSDLRGIGGSDFQYEVRLPRVTDVSDLRFVFRADRSAANILCKLDGGVDLNGWRPPGNTDPAFRDHPPALSSDIFLGYEQPEFVGRMGPEKFAAKNTERCALAALEAESWMVRVGSGSFLRTDGVGLNETPPDTVQFVYHDPEAILPGAIGVGRQYQEGASGIEIYAKTNAGLGGYRGSLYYTIDRSRPRGAGGAGSSDSTSTVPMAWVGDAEGGSWWRGVIERNRAGTIHYKVGVRRESVNPLFPSGEAEVNAKLKGMTVFQIDGFNGERVRFFPHNDYAKTPDQRSFEMETGLEEGFHIMRARAFLERTGRASLFNTFQQTFYYDASRPQGEIVFPAEGTILNGQSYEVVVRADKSVTEAWYFIDDGVGANDDGITGSMNGNGSGSWVKIPEVGADPGVVSDFPREFRFSYANIPSGNIPSTIRVRLREQTSADVSGWTALTSDLDDTEGWYTTLSRNVVADGLDGAFFVAYPAVDGEVVGDEYVLKTYFPKDLAEGVSDAELVEEFAVSIASTSSGSEVGGVVQSRGSFRIIRNETAEFHALSFDMPGLWNGDPGFLHHVRVTHRRSGVELSAVRLVRASEVLDPYINVVQPPAFDGGGQPWVEFIPDLIAPSPGQREIPIRVETDNRARHLEVAIEQGDGVLEFRGVRSVGRQQYWDYRWQGVEPGVYRIRVNLRENPLDVVVATALRVVTVALGPSVPVAQDMDADGLPDWWEIAKGLSVFDGGGGPGGGQDGPDGDPDGDGVSNLIEYVIGLDPNWPDLNSVPEFGIRSGGDGVVQLTFSGIPDRIYSVSWSVDLERWTPLGAVINTGAEVLPSQYEIIDGELSDTTQRYYRLEVALPERMR